MLLLAIPVVSAKETIAILVLCALPVPATARILLVHHSPKSGDGVFTHGRIRTHLKLLSGVTGAERSTARVPTIIPRIVAVQPGRASWLIRVGVGFLEHLRGALAGRWGAVSLEGLSPG